MPALPIPILSRDAIRRLLPPLIFGLLAVLFHTASWIWLGFWPGCWLGQVFFILLAVRLPIRTALGVGLLLGALINLIAFHWVPATLVTLLDTSWLIALSMSVALALWEGVSLGLFCGLVAWVGQRGVRWLYLVPVAWVITEFWWPRILPWMLAYTQLELLPIVQIAELTGATGIGFCLTAIAAIPAAVYLARQEQATSAANKYCLGYIVGTCLLLISVWSYGTWQLQLWRVPRPNAAPFNIAALQVFVAEAQAREELRDRTIALGNRIDLACWPEASIRSYSRALKAFDDELITFQNSRNAQLCLRPTLGCQCDVLVGGRAFRSDSSPEGPETQTAFLIDSRERILGMYHKRSLMPFGEYLPGQTYFPSLRHLVNLPVQFEPGDSTAPLVGSSGAKLGVVICYEDMLPGNSRATVGEGAEILISLINGYAMENPLALAQHQRCAVLRAVENRRYLVRCAATGITCVIAPTGEALATLPAQQNSQLQFATALLRDRTFYTTWGDLFPYGCTLLFVVSVWVSSRRTQS